MSGLPPSVNLNSESVPTLESQIDLIPISNGAASHDTVNLPRRGLNRQPSEDTLFDEEVYPSDKPEKLFQTEDTGRGKLVPRLPTDGDRYSRSRSQPSEYPKLTLKKGPCPIQTTRHHPADWQEDVHPEGQLLYSRTITIRNLHIRVHTDLALRTQENHAKALPALDQLLRLLSDCTELDGKHFGDSEIEACLVFKEKQPDEAGYYLVNHRIRTIFWLEEFKAEQIDLWALGGETLRLKLETQYWRYVTDFPSRCSLSSKAWDELGPLILSGAVDQEYCEESTIPRDVQSLTRLEAMWRQTKELRDNGSNSAMCNWICGRIWYDFVSTRAVNNWGSDYARLEKTTKIGDESPPSEVKRSWLTKIFHLLLWNEPSHVMKIMDDAWPGGVIYKAPWTAAINQLVNTWNTTLVLAAVTFLAAMIFIGITQDTESTGISLSASFGFISCALSAAGSIFALSWKHDFGGKVAGDVHEAGAFLQTLEGRGLGYAGCCLLMSLPQACTRWAIVSLIAGLATFAFQLAQMQENSLYAVAVVVGMLAIASATAARGLTQDRIRPVEFVRNRVSKTLAAMRESSTGTGVKVLSLVSNIRSGSETTNGDLAAIEEGRAAKA